MPEADGPAVAALAHSFARLRTYHHALFTAIKTRLLSVLDDLSAAEGARCLHAFARSVPPVSKADPAQFAFDAEMHPRGFGTVMGPLFRRLGQQLGRGEVCRETALLSLQAMGILSYR